METNKSKTDEKAELSFQFLGDISLDGLFCDPQHHQVVADNMSEIAAHLGPCDLRIGNFESPVWGTGGVNTLKNPRLCTTRQAAELLGPLELDVALLATNHIYDCREEGFENTISFLRDKGILWLGAGRTREEAAEPLIVTRKGMKTGLLNYCGDETEPSIPQDAGIVVNRLEEERVLEDVKQLSSQVDVVIVLFHWGEIERVRYPSVWQRKLARRTIEAGANLVVGGHAHALQGDEQWAGGHIFYSMGNFLFSPVLTTPGKAFGYTVPSSRKVGVATCTICDGKVVDRVWRFFSMDKGSVVLRPDDTPTRRKHQDRICRVLASSDKKLSRIRRWENRACLPVREFLFHSNGLLDMIRKVRLRHFGILFKSLRRSS